MRYTRQHELRDFLLKHSGATRRDIYEKHFGVEANLPYNKGGHQLENIITRARTANLITSVGHYRMKFYAIQD